MVKVAGKKAGAVSTEAGSKKKSKKSKGEEFNTLDASLSRYIKVWDEALPEEYCQKMISHYAEAGEYQIARSDGGLFVSCNIDRPTQFQKASETQKKIIEATLPVYADLTKPHPNSLPEQSVLEDTHIYHFRNENDHKEIGIDVAHIAQARRYLTLIWFLSDDPDFYLKFTDLGAKVESRAGRLLMFPSTWTYPYEIRNGSKQNYLLKTHLNFI